jgi:Tol biopolymer transport system component
MSAPDELDRRLAAWMTEVASSPPPAGRFEVVTAATARRRPLPGWLATFASDWVGTPAPRLIERSSLAVRRKLTLAVAVALLLAAAIIAAAVVGALLHRDRNPLLGPARGEWIAFSAENGPVAGPEGDYDIYIVGENRVARRIVGSDSDDLDQFCPVFSPNATRLAYGQGQRTSGYRDAALVIADVTTTGVVSNARTISVGGTFPPPCPVWSPDGRRIAFIVPSSTQAAGVQPAGAGAVWVVMVDSGEINKLPRVWASDVEWAPDGARLAIASGVEPDLTMPDVGGRILLYSVGSGEIESLPGASGVVQLAWSRDGRRIAYQRIRTPGTPANGGIIAGTETQEIWTIGADGTDRTLQTDPFDANQGIGPVWSPAGDRIVYQRICGSLPDRAAPCPEQHDVVLLTPGSTVSETDPAGSEMVLPPARAEGPEGASIWWPFEVSWSPDGQQLLYVAWSEPIGRSSSTESTAIVVVDPHGTLPTVVLRDATIAVANVGFVRIQASSWSRAPAGLRAP